MSSPTKQSNRPSRMFSTPMIFPLGRRFGFLAVWLIGLMLSGCIEGVLLAQYYDETPSKSSPKKSSTPSGGITIGGQSSSKKIAGPLSEDEDDFDDPKGGFRDNPITPGFIPSFGGGMGGGGGFMPNRMTRDEILRRRAEEVRRRDWELERLNQRIILEQRIKDEIEAALQNLRGDFDMREGEDTVPSVLRKSTVKPRNGEEQAGEEGKSDEKSTTKTPENSTAERKQTPSTPQYQYEESDSTARKTDDEIFEANIRESRSAAEQVEDAEERKRQLEAVEKREKARREWIAKRAQDETGAHFFELPAPLRLKEPELKAGWCNLFDGKTLFGWRTQKDGPYGGGRFHVVNQEIHSDPAHPGLLYTTNQFGDATLRFEYQADEDAEVILLVRTSPDPWDLNSSAYSIVLNTADYTQPRGTIIGRQALGVDSLKKGDRESGAVGAAPPGKRWRKASILFEGTMLQVSIDKEEPTTLFEAKPLGCGYVGILVAKGNARFRNMFWSPGSTVSLFDGINPDIDWVNIKTDVLQWKPTREITLAMTGGPGAVETIKSFDNFVLQFEYNITFTAGRAGLLIRSTPREEGTGYEVSLQNAPKKEDRLSTKGVDVGAFRGVKNGRFLRPEDQKWNYFTMIAVDRQFQTWVNGVPVCEWSVPKDKEFVRSGTLQILAPTANTNIQFRNIRFAPVRPRTEKSRSFEDRLQTTFVREKEVRNTAEIEKRLVEEKKIEYEKKKAK